MKSLKPSMRERKRYLLILGRDLKYNVEKSILSFIGVLGMSKTALQPIKVEKELSGVEKGIFSINREMLNQVRASFSVWPEKMEVLRVSGTLKSLREKS